MGVRLAIHERPGGYSDRWLAYCAEHDIAHAAVNCFDPGIIGQLRSFDGLLWHICNGLPEDAIFSKALVAAVERMGLVVFPSTATISHYDDKIAQKYVLEAVDAPMVPTYVFCEKAAAYAWIAETTFPKVFKLSRGAGSRNVWLVGSAGAARALVNQAFTSGFVAAERYFSDISARWRKVRGRGDLVQTLRRVPQSMGNVLRRRRVTGRERGYVYFQEFIPDNVHDTRVTIIGDRAFAFRRGVRPGDFRASGSGRINYDRDALDEQCLRIAFDVTRRVGAQSLAFDFVHQPDGTPLIVEISYSYDPSAVRACQGYWTPELAWRDWDGWPQDAMIEDVVAACRQRGRQGGKS